MSIGSIPKSLIAVAILVVAGFIFYCSCLNSIHINEIGVAYNSLDGSVMVQDKPGWYVTSPFISVTTISTLPMRVQIPSGAMVINQKMVRFKPEGVQEFIKLQGFHWGTTGQTMENIMLGYAYSGKEYPFLEIIQEAGPENTTPPVKSDWHKASGK